MSYKISVLCRNVMFFLFFLLMLQPVKAQYDWSELDGLLQSKQKLLGNNLVALVWKGDSLVYKKEMGDFNVKTPAPIASCSKWLTAALVMQFVDEGKLSLDDYVVRYIPEFEKYFKKYITIRQCLSHMTGIADEDKLLKSLARRKKFSSLEEEVNDMASRDIRANAGNDFWYGSTGLNIAARVLEVISKKRFEVLIKMKLLNPLGMRRTTFNTLDGSPPNPSGGAISTAEDYMKFLVMLLNKGKYNGVQVLSENAVEEMRKVRTNPEIIKYAPKAAQGFNYASGSWVIEESATPGQDGAKMGSALASPGLFGTWPMVDFCRGYAYLVFVKNFLGEERADAHLELKKAVDTQIQAECR
ncbi:MAG: serine hydrolase [Bacteroidetes bacterium]|nr:serine hydrolase [Bacteroidota bacterium]